MKERLLIVDAPHFYAGAVWRKEKEHDWVCIRTAPIIKWMRGKPAGEVRTYLKKKGWKYEWR